ncbi:Dol-P-Man:Man(7)GlcNAc(2)-PP-Dol alpha-1,6-mannosyltransferase-like protein [Sarcoptes scabiei]|uniref:Mannosyltransferase n=1 Tax=Sarcoptes scabiei TaxID=52283 RepID=A0A132AKG7_SARSC|nr:Dol-P-Man:Man(7)GlcNAc(2)-PP-Dol alpha-1,6-mannosyltransferase-like protein [Sarcoptes scabiei]
MFEKLNLNTFFSISIVFIASIIHLIITPYTKVEESFNVQAVHDFLLHSSDHSVDILFRSQNSSRFVWDHEKFPGVVHRTFLTSFVVAVLTKLLGLFVADDKFQYQLISRGCLAFLFSYTFSCFIRSLNKTLGTRIGILTTLLTITQFHLIFYSSRMLPNTFALILVLLAYSKWIEQDWRSFLFLFAFTVVVVRFETIILFGCICFVEIFLTKNLTLKQVFQYGIPSGLFSLSVTILFDSYIWNRWIWPEGEQNNYLMEVN